MHHPGFVDNICLLTDSYKLTHFVQYPPGTSTVYSYFESRTGARYRETVFFGLQYFLQQYLAGPVVTRRKVDEAEAFTRQHLGRPGLFNRSGWDWILDAHGGRLPVSIKAVAEGSAVPASQVLMTVENTDPHCWWLTNYLETLLVETWYPCTVASRGRALKATLRDALEHSGTPEQLEFKLHDFGFRGVSCPEQAAVGGAAHLVHFLGTDNLAGILLLQHFYAAGMAGFSIPASEHSTITAWGEDHEVDALRNMLDQFTEGTFACVSDSYDIGRTCRDYWGDALKSLVVGRRGTVVVRPDSGEPCGSVLGVLEALGEKFGTVRNPKGFRLLPDCIRVIQGDGIDDQSLGRVLDALHERQWSADNIAFGSGGGLLQKLDRDTQRFAFKCSYIEVDGTGRDVFKRPVGDPTKNSKRGRLKLVRSGDYQTVSQQTEGEDHLQ